MGSEVQYFVSPRLQQILTLSACLSVWLASWLAGLTWPSTLKGSHVWESPYHLPLWLLLPNSLLLLEAAQLCSLGRVYPDVPYQLVMWEVTRSPLTHPHSICSCPADLQSLMPNTCTYILVYMPHTSLSAVSMMVPHFLFTGCLTCSYSSQIDSHSGVPVLRPSGRLPVLACS